MSPPHSKVMRLRAPLASALVIMDLDRAQGVEEEGKAVRVRVRMQERVKYRSSVRAGIMYPGSMDSAHKTGLGLGVTGELYPIKVGQGLNRTRTPPP